MKKIILFLLSISLLTGCTSGGVYEPFFDKDSNVVLVDSLEEVLDDEGYDAIELVSNVGYIVEKNEKVAFISKRGEMTIKFGIYESLSNYGTLIVGVNDSLVDILDVSGQIIHTNDQEEIILEMGLPIIVDGNIYTVYDSSFTPLVQTDQEIISAYQYANIHTVINYKDTSVLYYQGGSVEGVEVALGGQYQLAGFSSELGHLLYDLVNQSIALVLNGEVVFEEKIELMNENCGVYFDDDYNILLQDQDEVHLISQQGKFIYTLNSYYHGIDGYVIENSEFVYGPHYFYFEGEKYEISGIQLDPFASYTHSTIIPVFENGSNYTYFNFKGEQVIDEYFDEASMFDQNERAVVTKTNRVYLIDQDGNYVSSAYKNIEPLGQTFYVGYITDNQYVILDLNGNEVIDNIFMGYNTIVYRDGNVYGLFTKSTRTMVYNMDTLEVVFEIPGISYLYNDAYLLINDVYYTIEGKRVWKR